jgi:hypothetical protein
VGGDPDDGVGAAVSVDFPYTIESPVLR